MELTQALALQDGRSTLCLSGVRQPDLDRSCWEGLRWPPGPEPTAPLPRLTPDGDAPLTEPERAKETQKESFCGQNAFVPYTSMPGPPGHPEMGLLHLGEAGVLASGFSGSESYVCCDLGGNSASSHL